MTFKISGAIFKNTAEKLKQRFGDRYDANKKYPDVSGVFGIKEADREHWLTMSQMQSQMRMVRFNCR